MTPVVFWFEFASTYSYLAAERLRAEHHRPPRVVWRPFLLGPILKAQGLETSPFEVFPVKGAYMWRDVERVADRQGLQIRKPKPFPQNGLLAARIATAFDHEPWFFDFVCAVFRAQFAHGRDIGQAETIEDVLSGMGLPISAVLGEAEQPQTKAKVRDATEQAQRLGIFGAPSFTVGRELFWGQDRFDQAFDWAAHHHAKA